MPSRRFVLRENATLVAVDDERVLLDAERRCYYSMNDVAFFILQLAESGCMLNDARRSLAARFDVTEHATAADLDRFVSDAAALGVVRVDECEEDSPSRTPAVGRPVGTRWPYAVPALERESELLTALAQITPLTISVSI